MSKLQNVSTYIRANIVTDHAVADPLCQESGRFCFVALAEARALFGIDAVFDSIYAPGNSVPSVQFSQEGLVSGAESPNQCGISTEKRGDTARGAFNNRHRF